jgi:hypothetical protein
LAVAVCGGMYQAKRIVSFCAEAGATADRLKAAAAAINGSDFIWTFLLKPPHYCYAFFVHPQIPFFAIILERPLKKCRNVLNR